ncbi:MAG: TonB-dependent receptor plug domain-containing protein [Calditrichaeota bacterium]|nr:TonB-dependent receptor plug domain-containing protein [Calditrichota bacterium]
MIKRLVAAISIILICSAMQVLAGTTGKIAGIVKDKENGDPLPGVNVVIEGTSLGAATNINGRYFILNIPPGTYSLRAKMIGYADMRKKDVEVKIDRTSQVDFMMQAQVLELGKVVTVTANRELVRKDVSFSQTTMDEKAIDNIPAAYQLDKGLVSQAGIKDEGQGIVIRRGGYREISYYLDGMLLKDDRTGRNVSRLSTTAIQQVQILAGGFNAEYGNARSGIVNVVTKNPGKRYNLNFQGSYSPLMGKYNGRKHFGPYVYSKDNWWEYGRFLWNEGNPSQDRNADGEPDFEGWNEWITTHIFHGQTLTPRQAYEVWAWQHRSTDKDGNILIDQKPAYFTDENGELNTKKEDANHPLNYYAYNPDWNVDLTFSGPIIPWGNKIPILKNTGFVLSYHQEYSMYPFFAAQQAYIDKTSQLKIVSNITPNIKLFLNGYYSDRRSANPQGYEGTWSGTGHDFGNSTLAMFEAYKKNYYIFAYDGIMTPRKTYTAQSSIKLMHTLSPRTFYQVQFQYGQVRYNKDPRSWRRSYEPAIAIGPVTLTEIPKKWNAGFDQADDRYDMLGKWMNHHIGEADYSWEKDYRLTADVTSQVNDHNQFKSGIEVKAIESFDFYGGIQYPEFYLESDWADPPGPGKEFMFTKPYDKIHQLYGALYVQDKIEYSGMIMNVGVRFDYYKPTPTWYDRSDPFRGWSIPDPDLFAPIWGLQDTLTYYGREADSHPPAQFSVSPRFGVSHPIGPESKIYFNYGHFYQRAPYRALYAFSGGRDNWSQMSAWGNPWLKFPKTIQYEVGYEQRLFGDYVINISGYYKDITNDVAWIYYRPRPGAGYNYPYNAISRDIKGFEVAIRKNYGKFITGFINSDYNIEKRSDLGWSSFYNPESQQYLADPSYVTYLRVVSNPYGAAFQYPGDWRLKANINLHTPTNFGPGPKMLGSKLLGDWQLNVFHEWRLGSPYTYNPENIESLRYVLNHRKKDFNLTSLKVGKKFVVAGVNMELFCSITNLFNVRDSFTNPFEVAGYGGDTDYKRRDVHTSAYDDVSHWKEYNIKYMEELFKEGKKFGDVVDDSYMPQRQYIMWYPPRDYWFGLNFYF